MSFPDGWTYNHMQGHYQRAVEPTAAALAYTIMTLPADTAMKYAVVDAINYSEPVTMITYDPQAQEAVLS